MNRVEYEGVWWRPGTEDTKVQGRLVVGGNEMVTLNVHGTLSPLDADGEDPGLERVITAFSSPINIDDLLYGETEKGIPVTLRDCRAGDSINPGTGYRRESYHCRAAFVGRHYEDVESIRSPNATFTFSHLKWFAQRNALDKVIFPQDCPRTEFGFHFAEPEPVIGNAGTFGTVNIECRLSFMQRPHVGLDVKQSEYLRVTNAPSETTFEKWITDYMEPLQYLMTLATETPNHVTSMFFDFMMDNPVQVYFWVPSLKQDPPEEHNANPLVSLTDINDDFGGAMRRWLEAKEDLDGVFDFYFGQEYMSEQNRQSRVRELSQAIEVFHERHIDSRKMLFEERVSKYLEWLGDVMKPLIKDPAQFARDVTQTRHYLTHYNRARQPDAVHGFDLHVLSRFLAIMIRAGLMRTLGLSQERVQEQFEMNPRYQQLARHPWR